MTYAAAITRVVVLGLAGLVAAGGCETHYAYTFHLVEPGARAAAAAPGGPLTVEDANVRAVILVDAAAGAVRLDLANKTDQVLQVEWEAISITHPDGRVTTLRPDVDLGWIRPGAEVTARLFPMALPQTGSKALAYEGKRFRLDLPVIVRREPAVYHFTLAAEVRPR